MTAGLLLTAFTLGLRHGVDWDHIAAIADLSGSADSRRRGFVLSMLYAVGHAAVVLALGAAAIGLGSALPSGVDEWMGRVVGITLIALGAWIVIELARKRREFRLRSRWMLVLDGTFSGLRRVRAAGTRRLIRVEHDHRHVHDPPDGDHESVGAHDHAHFDGPVVAQVPVPAGSGWSSRRSRAVAAAHSVHAHPHRHELTLPSSPTARYGGGTATGIGMVHGVGVESPTQIAVFVASTSVAGAGVGLLLLLVWVVGLVAANAVLAIAAGAGLLHAERSFGIYATIAVVVATLSIALGTLYLLGIDALPGILV